MNNESKEKLDKEQEKAESGDQLLNEYHKQDRDDKHYMGYSVYTQTSGGGCC